MAKHIGAAVAVIGWLAGISAAGADSGWNGPGWYEVGALGIIIGPLDSKEDCEGYAEPDAQAHPDYGYQCVYLDSDPDSN
jgi:hypothetical protein